MNLLQNQLSGKLQNQIKQTLHSPKVLPAIQIPYTYIIMLNNHSDIYLLVSLLLHGEVLEEQRDKENKEALAGVAQWTEHRPANQTVATLTPSQGTCLGCGPGHQ